MDSLKQLIEQGQYELAAHRLVFGAVATHLEEQREGAARDEGDSGVDSGPAAPEQQGDG